MTYNPVRYEEPRTRQDIPMRPSSDRGDVALSIVTTLYRSLDYLPRFLSECRAALSSAGIQQHEILFVNDGSPDASGAWVLDQRNDDPRIKLLDLSRNFGHHRAALAGLSYARGERTFLIDCDLEVAPGELLRMLEVMRDSGADVVYGVQEQRKGGAIERMGGSAFWRLFNSLSDTVVPENVLTERLMTRRYVDALLSLGDRNVFLAGMMYWTGFVQVGIPIAKTLREGRSTYSLRRRISLLVEAVTSFSTLPLKLTLGIGLMFMLTSVAFGFAMLLKKLLFPDTVLLGFTSLMLVILAVGGVVITLMGVLGLYVAKLFVQSQGRPTFIVREYNG